MKTCQQCNVEFKTYKKTAKYCSKKCYDKSMEKKVELVCNFCNKKWKAIPSRITRHDGGGKYCSAKCTYSAWKNKWSMKYDCCIRCGTTEKKHMGFGLCIPCGVREKNLARYGLTIAQFDSMVLTQGNRCSICKNQFTSSFNTHIDHDHITGKVRGILCDKCNNGLGCFKDDIQKLQAAIEYLTLHQQPDKVGLWSETQKDNTSKQIPQTDSGIKYEKPILAGFGQEHLMLRDME